PFLQDLAHVDQHGAARMVDVGDQATTDRRAVASCRVTMQPATLQRISQPGHPKGNVLEVARLAGIMGAKQTGSLIPLCHPLGLDAVEVDLEICPPQTVEITSRVRTTGKTGVEMEALTAAAVAALTVYDMVKSVDRGVVIEGLQLEQKSGGKSGNWERPTEEPTPAT